jgi:ribose transport system substrate-binding protein
VKQGKVEMDIGQSLDWIARAVVDFEMRDYLGMPLPTDENIGIRIWTADNINEALGPDGKAAYSTGYGNAYQAGYATLWGLPATAIASPSAS